LILFPNTWVRANIKIQLGQIFKNLIKVNFEVTFLGALPKA
jgi:hypothetical protein